MLSFRAVAWLDPSRFITLPEPLALPLNMLGVLFLACGVWVWLSKPSRLTRVFLVYAIGGTVHWGGAIGAESQGRAIAWLVLYMAGAVMAEAAFLDLSLRFPRALPQRRLRGIALYLPAILVLLAIPITPFLSLQIVEVMAGAVFLVANLMSLAAAVVFLVKWFRATSVERRAHSLTLIAGVVVLLGVMALLGALETLPGEPDAWNLMSGLLPLALAWALTRAPVRASWQ